MPAKTNAENQKNHRLRHQSYVREILSYVRMMDAKIMKLNEDMESLRKEIDNLKVPPLDPPSLPSGLPSYPPIIPPSKLSIRASRLSPDWAPSESERKYAFDKGVPNVDLTAEKFRNHWLAKSGKDGTKRDWSAAWRNWCLGELERKGTLTNGHDTSVSIDRARERAEAESAKRRMEAALC